MNWIRIIFVLAVIGACSHAADYIAAPKWQVKVVNDKGEPLARCEVEQTWSYYFGSGSAEARTNTVTDSSGQVALPERKVSVAGRKVFAGRLAGALNVHSSYGPRSSIYVSKDGYDRVSVWRNPNLPLLNEVFQSTVVLKLKKRPAALTEAILTGGLEKLKSELQKDPYYATGMPHGVKLLNDVIRSSNANGTNAVEMMKAVLDYLGRPNVAALGKTYGPGYGMMPYVDFRDDDYLTALRRTIQLRKFEAAEYLLSIGVMPNPEASWQSPVMPSALHLAAQSNNVKIVKALLERKADLNAKDAVGKTPLDWAKQAGNQEIVRLLETAK